MTALHATRLRQVIQLSGLVGGPAGAVILFLLLPERFVDAGGSEAAFTAAGRATLAVMLWLAVWWLTEAIDIAATALLPLAAFPIIGITGAGKSAAAAMKEAAAPYADPLIFLFLGGFLLALSMQRWGLGKRIALLTLRLVGTKPANMVGGFMLATGVLSAFVSNTATAAMMLPIGLSVIALVRQTHGAEPLEGAVRQDDVAGNFSLCLMLGIAYAASIGGIATIIGTPPNAFLVGFLRETIDQPYRTDISFAKWLAIGVPFAAVFLPIVWLMLTRVLYPIRIKDVPGGRELLRDELRRLGPPNRGEWVTFIVFMGTALAWITQPILSGGWAREVDSGTGEVLSWIMPPLAPHLTDTGIAMIGGLALFVIPISFKPLQCAMNWQTTQQLPWGILILFGGGLSLAAAVQANGVAEFLGSQAARFAGMPTIVIVLIVTAGVIFLTELTSNTATTATLVPVLAAVAPGLGIEP